MEKIWTKIKEFFQDIFEKHTFLKWLAPLLVAVILAMPIAFFGCKKDDGKQSSSSTQNQATAPDFDLEELLRKNKALTMLQENKTVLATFTERDGRDKIKSQDTYYYSYANGELYVDYRKKSGEGKTLLSGTYLPGVFYALENDATYVTFLPQADFTAFVSSFVSMDIPETLTKQDFTLVDGSLVVTVKSVDKEGYQCQWAYSFDGESLQLNKATSLVYRNDGVFVKSQECVFAYNQTTDFVRAAYNEIVNPADHQTAKVTVRYLNNGSVSHSRDFQLSKNKNLYAKDILANEEYCVYTDVTCTNQLCDLSEISEKDNAEVYVAKAKDGDVATRDLNFAKRDNQLSRIMSEYNTYFVHYQMFTAKGELYQQQYWYYDAKRAETVDQLDGDMTLNFLEKDDNNTVTKVVNFRDRAFYTWSLDNTADGKREFALVLDADFESVLFDYGKQSMGEQTIKTPMLVNNDKYQLVTMRTEKAQEYKTSQWTYSFKKTAGKFVLESISVEYLSSASELVYYAEVKISYGETWKANTDAYDKIAGNRAGTKVSGNFVIDYQTLQVRNVPYALNSKTYISVYPTALGKTYAMYRSDLVSPITNIGVLAQSLKKDVYVIPKYAS